MTIKENVQIVKEPAKITRSEEIELSYDKVVITKRPVKADINNYNDRTIDTIAENNSSTINTIKKSRTRS